MGKKVNCIMLIDDNPDDNFFHERVIRKNDFAHLVVTRQTGKEALEYLTDEERNKDQYPDIIFLDVNMPGMNGWEFLEEYKKLDQRLQSSMIVVMLTTSENPDDLAKSKKLGIAHGFRTKPLTKEVLDKILDAME